MVSTEESFRETLGKSQKAATPAEGYAGRIAASVLDTVGGTPLVRLSKLFPLAPFELYAKLEALNPGGSIKDRPAVEIIAQGLRSGTIGAGTVIVESNSGNMGIALAQACRYHGLRFICVVDPKTSPQNLKVLRAYGAEIDLVAEPDPASGEFLQARLDRVQALVRQVDGAVWPNQYESSHNPGSHFRTTMHEWRPPWMATSISSSPGPAPAARGPSRGGVVETTLPLDVDPSLCRARRGGCLLHPRPRGIRPRRRLARSLGAAAQRPGGGGAAGRTGPGSARDLAAAARLGLRRGRRRR